MRTAWLLGVLLLASFAGARAEDVISKAPAPYSGRGVSITKWVEGSSITWTNEASEPWYPVSIWTDNGVGNTNTITLDVIRLYDIQFQTKASDVTTNIFGQVETNVYTQVTNVFTRVMTNSISVTIVGSGSAAISIPFMIKGDDGLRITQTDTNGKPVVVNGQR